VLDVTARNAALVWSPGAVVPCVPDCSSVSSVYYNPNTGLYRQSAVALTAPWQKSAFSRVITIVGVDDPVNPQRQARIQVTVSYLGFGGAMKSVVVKDDLYNWFPPLH
jgi:hypothetical protein